MDNNLSFVERIAKYREWHQTLWFDVAVETKQSAFQTFHALVGLGEEIIELEEVLPFLAHGKYAETVKELGDVLYYTFAVAGELRLSHFQVARGFTLGLPSSSIREKLKANTSDFREIESWLKSLRVRYKAMAGLVKKYLLSTSYSTRNITIGQVSDSFDLFTSTLQYGIFSITGLDLAYLMKQNTIKLTSRYGIENTYLPENKMPEILQG